MGFLYSQIFKQLPYPNDSYIGQTIIVTGSNVGLGKEAARHFLRLGASRLILAVRDLRKGQVAKEDIVASTRCPSAVVQVWQLDMADYTSVQRFAARVNSELDRVDIFLANAGIAPAHYATAEDDEASITVNVVSTLLLAALILPKLKATAATFNIRPTLTITSSDVHGHTTVPQKEAPDGQLFAQISDKDTAEKYWNEQYPISKLLQVLAVRAIAERNVASEFPVTINCVNPGLCHSELGRDFGWGFMLIKFFLARSTEIGSRALVHAASQGAESHGQYLTDGEIGSPSAFVMSRQGKEIQDRMWDELVKKLEAVQPGLGEVF